MARFVPLVLFVGISLLSLTTDESRGSAAKPRLSVVSTTPLVVAGTGFRAGETVRLIVKADAGASSRRDEASGAGRISVRFRGLEVDRCDYLIITARGDKGSLAQLRRMPRACAIDPRRDQ
jgi:hypothetical protein